MHVFTFAFIIIKFDLHMREQTSKVLADIFKCMWSLNKLHTNFAVKSSGDFNAVLKIASISFPFFPWRQTQNQDQFVILARVLLFRHQPNDQSHFFSWFSEPYCLGWRTAATCTSQNRFWKITLATATSCEGIQNSSPPEQPQLKNQSMCFTDLWPIRY